MTKTYSLDNSQNSNIREYRFDIQQEAMKELTPTYSEVLRILREAFSLVDITQIVKKIQLPKSTDLFTTLLKGSNRIFTPQHLRLLQRALRLSLKQAILLLKPDLPDDISLQQT